MGITSQHMMLWSHSLQSFSEAGKKNRTRKNFSRKYDLITRGQMWWCTPLKQRKVFLCEFRVSLIFIVHPRTARARERDPVSN